jgi:predicted GTPase
MRFLNKRYSILYEPVTLFDTAGIDDTSVLGSKRIEKTYKTFDSSDIVILVCETGKFCSFEENIIREADKRKTLCVIAVSKTDLIPPDRMFLEKFFKYTKYVMLFSSVSRNRDDFLNAFKKILLEVLPDKNYSALRNIVKIGDTVVLVMPIDLGTPR